MAPWPPAPQPRHRWRRRHSGAGSRRGPAPCAVVVMAVTPPPTAHAVAGPCRGWDRAQAPSGRDAVELLGWQVDRRARPERRASVIDEESWPSTPAWGVETAATGTSLYGWVRTAPTWSRSRHDFPCSRTESSVPLGGSVVRRDARTTSSRLEEFVPSPDRAIASRGHDVAPVV